MDQKGKGEEMVSDHHKSCVDCKTTKTPLWRSGPSGPKSLCNACGIRYRKKRDVTTTRDSKKYLPEKKESAGEEEEEDGNHGIGKEKFDKKRKVSEELKSRVMALGKEVVVLRQQQQQPRSPVKRRRRKGNDHYWRKMGEVEQAAVLLMALSCGSAF